MDSNCIFCKIINGDIPADKVYEDDFAIAFMDIRPVSRGHTLVVPKQHVPDVVSAPDEVLVKFLPLLKKISSTVVKATNASGFNLSFNTGESAGQTVFHLHAYIIPRFGGDDLKPWPHNDMEPKTRKEVAEEIKNFLNE